MKFAVKILEKNKRFIFSTVAGLKPAALLKKNFFKGIPQGFLLQISEHLFCGKPKAAPVCLN